jgi:hypothetical protein
MRFWTKKREELEAAKAPPRTDEQKMDEMSHSFDLRRCGSDGQALYEEIMRFRRTFG